MNWIRNFLPGNLPASSSRVAPTQNGGTLRDLLARARAAQDKAQWADACALWQMVVEQDPTNAGYWMQLGNMRNELAEYKAALEAFETARVLEPANPDTTAGTAGVYERKGGWEEAARYWEETVSLLLDNQTQAKDRDASLKHAFRHGAMSSLNAGDRQNAAEFLLRGTETLPGFSADKAQYRLRAQMIKASEPVRAKALLGDYLAAHPDDRGAAFDYASLSLEDGAYEAGLAVFTPLLRQKDINPDFLWLAADLNERLRRWPAGIAYCERLVTMRPDFRPYYTRLFDMQRRNRDLAGCRVTAARYARQFDSLDLVHSLISLYEDAGEDHHARLICRWMIRAWPHSSWHQQHYINLAASTLSLSEADRLIRAYIEENGRDNDIEIIYCMAAYRSGNMLEAKRRLLHYIEQNPQDEDRQIMLGYVLANTDGIDAAEDHFAGLAVRSYQGKGPLIGLAHMAMRRRDTHATHQRWRHVVTLYPEDTIGRVELARSAYELRHYAEARQICEEQLRRMPQDVTMAEFYAWLLVATGRLEQAAALIKALQTRTGASWATLELAIQASAQLGRIDAEASQIFVHTPSSNSFDDAKRFYHVARQLWCAERPNLLPNALAKVGFPPKEVPWLYPYLERTKAKPANAAALKASWAQHRALVRADIVDFVSKADDATIAAIVNRPLYEQPTIHVVNKFEQVSGGSELHALDVAQKLGKHARVKLWAPETPHPAFSKRFGVQGIEPGQGHVPHDGIIVLIGVYFDVASWISWSRPKRVIILYNTFEAPLLFKRISEIHVKTGVKPELLYCSDMMGEEVGLPGFFEPSPIDIDLFVPAAIPAPKGRFVLGRHSRDVMEKHHPEDWRIYQAVAEEGGHSSLLGGTCMKDVFPPLKNTDYLPARSEGIVPFLQSLDCYLYRTSTWIEPWGRVVIEAMACAVPVLASRVGGYAQVIEHDVNGLLFDTTEEAVALVRALARDPARRQRLGQAGRRTAEQLLGVQAMERIVSFYLADGK
jgi:glycosyltransferase involved in cell wall biosynthesis/cytochrome c-type biogenesis protein CcmH/NrfG